MGVGVALARTDAGSNALFGNLQTATATRLGLSPILMGAANSTGGVMGKMIDAQSIVVASTATRQAGQEAAIFKGVFVHSIAARVPWSCWPMLTCSPRSFHDGSEVRVSHR